MEAQFPDAQLLLSSPPPPAPRVPTHLSRLEGAERTRPAPRQQCTRPSPHRDLGSRSGLGTRRHRSSRSSPAPGHHTGHRHFPDALPLAEVRLGCLPKSSVHPVHKSLVHLWPPSWSEPRNRPIRERHSVGASQLKPIRAGFCGDWPIGLRASSASWAGLLIRGFAVSSASLATTGAGSVCPPVVRGFFLSWAPGPGTLMTFNL